jgi:hypothetical protein
MMGLGRITKKRSTVTKMLSASASDLKSEQWEREAVENLNERGKTVGKPIEVRPCAERGRKSVKFPIRLALAQPPFESLI